MNLEEIRSQLNATLLTSGGDLSRTIQSAFSSDMMSDVLAFVRHDSILITGLCNPQVIRTAEMLDLAGVVFVRNKRPDETTLRLAEEIRLCVMTTTLSMFTACGRLYGAGLKGEVCSHDGTAPL